MARGAGPRKWLRHIKGTDMKYDDETKARNMQRASRSGTTEHVLDPESRLCEDVKIGISSFFAFTYPSLSLGHRRVLVEEMRKFLQVCLEEPKLEQVDRGRALPACSYFLDWLATQVGDTHELYHAVEALKRAMKDNRHHLPQSCSEPST